MQAEDLTQVYVFLSPGIEALLADNQISIAELLESEGLSAKQAFASNPATGEATGSKEPVTVLIASAALVVALTPVLTRLIERISRQPVAIVERVLVPVEDSKGRVLRDANGEPILKWQDRTRVIKAEVTPKEQTKLDISGPLGISIKYSNRSKE